MFVPTVASPLKMCFLNKKMRKDKTWHEVVSSSQSFYFVKRQNRYSYFRLINLLCILMIVRGLRH